MFWVGTSDSELLLIDKEGRTNLKVELPGTPWHTIITGPDDVIVSTQQHVIYKVTRQGQVIKFINVSPDEVYGITSTQQGDVYACVLSDSVWKVKKFSEEGKFLLEFDPDMLTSYNNRVFIQAVHSNLICIQDGNPSIDAECCLTFVTASGQFESRVNRTGKLLEDTRSIVWDDRDNMLAGIWFDEYVYVFSKEGACKQRYKVEGSGRVLDLCLGKDGVIWIGTGEGEVIKAKYLQ